MSSESTDSPEESPPSPVIKGKETEGDKTETTRRGLPGVGLILVLLLLFATSLTDLISKRHVRVSGAVDKRCKATSTAPIARSCRLRITVRSVQVKPSSLA